MEHRRLGSSGLYLGEIAYGNWFTHGRPERPWPVPQNVTESINSSFRRLQTDYVDLYQAHRYDYETPLEETMQAFADHRPDLLVPARPGSPHRQVHPRGGSSSRLPLPCRQR
jgi:aryl-alcohol dehydrogenase-like predicted oxidoreductase